MSEVAAEWEAAIVFLSYFLLRELFSIDLIHSRDRGQICARLLWLCIRGKCAFWASVFSVCVVREWLLRNCTLVFFVWKSPLACVSTALYLFLFDCIDQLFIKWKRCQ